MDVQTTTEFKIPFTLESDSSLGNPAALDGAPIPESTDSNIIFERNEAADVPADKRWGFFARAIDVNTPAQGDVTAHADPDLGPDVGDINVAVGNFAFILPTAAALVATVGEPVPL